MYLKNSITDLLRFVYALIIYETQKDFNDCTVIYHFMNIEKGAF